MARKRRRKALPKEAFPIAIESLSHDGRGIGRIEGKTVFVDGVLPGEEVTFTYTDSKRQYDEGRAQEILKPAANRQQPVCEHALICGGCSLQHLDCAEQIAFKQDTLLEQFAHFGNGVQPKEVVEPLLGPTEGYRRKARLAVKHVPKKGGVLVGFREKRNSFITDIHSCAVLDPRVGEMIEPLKEMIGLLSVHARLPQIEVAMGDQEVALVFRHLDPVTEADQQILLDFCQSRELHCYLQPGGLDTVHRIWPDSGEDRLFYELSEFGVKFAFHPTDFTQVNAAINEQMVSRAISWLDLQTEDQVLDLFCGLGNFTLPIATRVARVVGVEGSEALVQRGRENAQRNQLNNVEFFAADLTQDMSQAPWAEKGFNKILLDPARSGALEIIQMLPKFNAQTIVYVSCNPATLARDAGALCQLGYELECTGVMDMFPHTTHVESIAKFRKK